MKLLLHPIRKLRRKLMFARRRNIGYGAIETGFLHYITPRMAVPLLILILLIFLNLHVFLEYYHAARTLNTVIFVSFGFAILKGFTNNIMVRNAALFLKHIDTIIKRGTITSQEMQLLLYRLKTQGRLLNTSDMYVCVRNIEVFGHPNFSDKNAQIIKSKLGFRIGEARKGVSFVGGLLVMFGLIGTYLGLLETVKTVGGVMTKMSSIGGDSGGNGMSNFISELAEPLQGMALAFSASLFGISGSVFVSIFGSAAAHAQGEFIENVSRWIDDRIMRPDMISDKVKKVAKLPGSDDLKAWLAGFVNLSIHTNRKMGQFLYTFSRSHQTALKSMEVMERVLVAQTQTQDLVKDVASSLKDLTHMHNQYSPQLNKIDEQLVNVQSDVASLAGSAGLVPELATRIQELSASLVTTQQTLQSHMGRLQHQVEQSQAQSQNNEAVLRALPDMLTQVVNTQSQTRDLLAVWPQSVQDNSRIETELTAILSQLNMLMEEMNMRNIDMFEDVFAPGEQDDPAAPHIRIE